MKKLLTFLLLLFATFFISCNKCQICTANQEGEKIEREICGRKRNVGPLISALESDTSGVGPWICEK